MFYESGNRILNRMEQTFGRFALAHILRWIAGFQFFTWLLSKISPDFLTWLLYDQRAILSGQVWRAFSWIIYPAADNFIFVLFALFFLFFINDYLESSWGTFRLNVYVFASAGLLTLAGLIPIGVNPASLFDTIFYSTAFLAFATLFPNQTIYLLAIIPIRAKWLGWLNVGILLMAVFSSPLPFFTAAFILLGFIPYFLVFAPGFANEWATRSAVKVRRHRFETGADSATFHTCDKCGATEQTNPERDFRVAADGNEYCSECRKNNP